MLVKEVKEGGPSWNAKIRALDLIQQINGVPIRYTPVLFALVMTYTPTFVVVALFCMIRDVCTP